jgi:hypothetical protein
LYSARQDGIQFSGPNELQVIAQSGLEGSHRFLSTGERKNRPKSLNRSADSFYWDETALTGVAYLEMVSYNNIRRFEAAGNNRNAGKDFVDAMQISLEHPWGGD